MLRQARTEEIGRIMAFYAEVIEAQEKADFELYWRKDGYPSREMIETSIQRGEFYVEAEEAEIAGGMILNHIANEDYKKGNWKVEAEPEETAVIHALAVAPEQRRKGTALLMLKQVVEICRKQKDKAIRLDVLAGNLAAAKLYEKAGFRLVSKISMTYKETGKEMFGLYEYEL